MDPLLNNPSPIKDNNVIRRGNGFEFVGNDNHGAILYQPVDSRLNRRSLIASYEKHYCLSGFLRQSHISTNRTALDLI
jgi:hypothetical protein